MEQFIAKLLFVLIGVLSSGAVGMLFWFTKKYFDSKKDKDEIFTKCECSGPEVLTAIARLEEALKSMGKDFTRVEGNIETLRKSQIDYMEKITINTTRLEALFRVIDAPKRASDIGGK